MRQKQKSVIIGSLILLLCLSGFSFATKPCPASVCFNEFNRFDEARCREKSDWIAVGTISKVIHQHEGSPLNSDFAKFTLQVKSWEKGGKGLPSELEFQVGWCENQKELPSDTSGVFKFYGSMQLAPISKGRQYHYFEVLKK